MKKQLLFLSLFFTAVIAFSQSNNEDFKPNGDVNFKIFWNYHADFTPNVTKTSAFELDRAYLGYKYNFSKDISAKVTLDVGSNSGGSQYTAYLKAAQLDWKVASGVKLSMGLIGLKQFNDQEGFWGYRYLYKSFQDANGFGTSADLGVNAEFSLAKNLKANVVVFNGEGYKNLQDTSGNQTFGGSLIFTPVNGLTTKIYVDTQSNPVTDAVTSLALFAGYDSGDWRLGAEYNKLNNATKYSNPAADHNLDGFSFYTTYVFNKQFEVFGRFDQLNSNTLTGESTDWNIAKDGNQIIAGLQYAPIKGIKFALNYQGYNFDNAISDNHSMVFLNAEFKL